MLHVSERPRRAVGVPGGACGGQGAAVGGGVTEGVGGVQGLCHPGGGLRDRRLAQTHVHAVQQALMTTHTALRYMLSSRL